MGHIITTDGLQPNSATSYAVVTMPTPTDKQGVRRFLGAINYLSRFCPQLSSVTHPYATLPKMAHYSYGQAKALAISAPCLAYYDVNAPVVL